MRPKILNKKAHVADMGKTDGPHTGDAEQSGGKVNPMAVGKQEVAAPQAMAMKAPGQMGPGHLLRALMMKGMKG